MTVQVTLDVVIPTARLDPVLLGQLLGIAIPPGLHARFIVVVDRPHASLPPLLWEILGRDDVTLLINEEPRGAAESRNRGFAAGQGEFVLFLDDDVVPGPGLLSAYLVAICADDHESPGYVGVTWFPPPVNRFTRGIWASDMLTFFAAAAERAHLGWGVTANLCVRRACVHGTPFSPLFPRLGGGEDVDFCLRLQNQAGKPFRSVPDAVVHHPWWNEGKRSYRRFFRWAYGDSQLPALHPHHRFLDFPTLPELWLCLLLLLPWFVWRGLVVEAGLFLAGSMIVELVVDYVALSLRHGGLNPASSAEATVICLSNDLGRLMRHVRHLRVAGLLERFDYFGTGESIAYERTVNGAKFLGSVALAWVLFL
jgi:GT2 family glycosyltransferase